MAQVAKKKVVLLHAPAVLPHAPTDVPRDGAPLAATTRATTIAPKTATHGVLSHDDSGAIDRWDRRWFCCATLCLVALVVVALWVVIYTLRGPQKRLTSTPIPEAFRGWVVPETAPPVTVHPAGDVDSEEVGASDESSPRQPDESDGDSVGDEGGFSITEAAGAEGGFNATEAVGDDAEQQSTVSATSDDYESG